MRCKRPRARWWGEFILAGGAWSSASCASSSTAADAGGKGYSLTCRPVELPQICSILGRPACLKPMEGATALRRTMESPLQ